MKLNITFSRKKELERVESTLKKLDFYRKNNYEPVLPYKINTDSNTIEIKAAIAKEWNKTLYTDAIAKIKSEWPKIASSIENNIKETGLTPKPAYDVVLTKYGVSGSYQPPHTVIVNILRANGDNKSAYDLTKTIAHEITHLLVESIIVKNNTSHWNKEVIVSKFLSILCPDFQTNEQTRQNEKISGLFEKHYPEIETIIQLIEGPAVSKSSPLLS